MKPLTLLEYERLVTRVAESLAWAGRSELEQSNYLYRARIIVRDLEGVAVHGATDKRAAETVLSSGLDREASA